jgi:diguanylate cyclase (GGDEF)-like protein/PAS domain S-box-containing protein
MLFLLTLIWLGLGIRRLNRTNGRLVHVAAMNLVLADAATGLAAARDIPSVATIGVGAAVGLAGDPAAWAAYAIAGTPTAMAVAGPAPFLAGQRVHLDHISSSKRPGWTQVAVPVITSEVIRGTLVLCHPEPTVAALAPLLDVIAVQMGLAIEIAEVAIERLRSYERRFRSLTQHSSDAVTLLDPTGVVLYQSAGGRILLGLEPEALIGLTFIPLTHPDDAARSRAQFIKVLHGGPSARTTYESRFRHVDGEWRQIETVLTNMLDDPDVAAIVVNSRDVTARRVLEAELSHQAFHDPLTGLANRALFLNRVAHVLDRTDREPGQIAVMFVDIDDFKMVNDSLGHHLGDGVLVAVAERLTAATRPGDTVARLGGDEFAVLLESGTMPRAAEVVADRIAQRLLPPVRIGAEDLSVRASIGVALGTPPADRADELLRDADLAMYLAKRNGKGRFEMFHPQMHEEAVLRLETSADLRRGIEQGQFEVFYQPIVDVQTATTIGAEALVRWHHPFRGSVPPFDFISIAETTGLIVPLGKWVLYESCRQARAWQDAGITEGEFYVSVNLSARQIQDPALVADVEAALRESELPAGALVLEVTESVVMQDLATAVASLNALKELGLRLAIDDFGTGYSSLSSLRDLPVDIVKIDKSFIDRIAVDPEGAAIVEGVIALSRALGLTTVAEGVEHEEQLAVLRLLGCEALQGYLFAQPMTGKDFASLLSTSDDASFPPPILEPA